MSFSGIGIGVGVGVGVGIGIGIGAGNIGYQLLVYWSRWHGHLCHSLVLVLVLEILVLVSGGTSGWHWHLCHSLAQKIWLEAS